MVFFFLIEVSSISFFYFFISLFFSNFFWIFDWYSFRMERFGLIFDFFLIYIWNELDFNLIYLFLNFYLFRILINAIDCRIAVRKSIERIYGKFLNFDVLLYYFDNLINNTTLIDFWLIQNNLDGKKLVKIFVLVLSSFNKTFNVCRRPFHSFFNRFYDILVFLRKIKNNRKGLKKIL